MAASQCMKAMNEAIAKLKKLPFSARLIRDTHKILMQGVRDRHKEPGGSGKVRTGSAEQ